MLWTIYESVRNWLANLTPSETWFFGFILSGVLTWHAAKLWYTGSLDDPEEELDAEEEFDAKAEGYER